MNRKSTIGLSMSHQPRLCITPNSLKWGSDTQICHFLHKFQPKTIKSLLESFIV